MTEPAARRRSARPLRKQRGSATAEYAIVAMLVLIVLMSNDNVIRQLATAIRDAYASFAYALSVSWL